MVELGRHPAHIARVAAFAGIGGFQMGWECRFAEGRGMQPVMAGEAWRYRRGMSVIEHCRFEQGGGVAILAEIVRRKMGWRLALGGGAIVAREAVVYKIGMVRLGIGDPGHKALVASRAVLPRRRCDVALNFASGHFAVMATVAARGADLRVIHVGG